MSSWWDTAKEYACPCITGALVVPLIFVPGVGWAAAYTAGSVTFGAGMGALAHGSNLSAEDIRDSVDTYVNVTTGTSRAVNDVAATNPHDPHVQYPYHPTLR